MTQAATQRTSFLPSLSTLAAFFFLRLLAVFGLTAQPTIYQHSEPATLVSLDRKTGEKRKTRLDDLLARCTSLVGRSAWYTPTPWLSSGHAATIYCTLGDFSYDHCHYSRRLIRVPDGGTLALDFTPAITPEDPIDSRPILVVLHGLTGGSHESYVIDVLGKVTKPTGAEGGLGWRGCVVNFRGCAGTPVTSNQLYHGGWTNDLRCALAYISHLAPKAPLYGTGFSLGANVLAKYLGEEGAATPLKAGIVLGCPWDFYDGHIYLSSSFLRLIYSKAMAKNLRTLLGRHKQVFEKDERLDWAALYGNPAQTLYEFDSLVTRVLGGFSSTEAYYRYASANQYAPNVQVPLLSISALDDPIVAASTIPTELAKSNPFLIFATTRHGGHLGFFSGLFRPRRWVGRPVLEFLREVERADPEPRIARATVPAWEEGRVPKVGDGMLLLEGETDIGFMEVEESELEGGVGRDADGREGAGEGLIRGL